jgi:polysaccharide export outer membrane protein
MALALAILSLWLAAASPVMAGSGGDYRIGKGDILRIVTWKEPELSIEKTMVRLDGKITFPLLDDVQAEGLSTLELKQLIEKRLAKFVESPLVTVTVLETVSQKYYILGEVQQTGEYPLTKNMTVLQAFAVAGGFTEWASKSEILLVRKTGDKETILRINYKDIVKGKDLNSNITLQADDTIIVP